MTRDPIDELERQLRGAVRLHAAPRRSWTSRVRARLGLPVVIVAGVIGVGGGGALAATQLLTEGPPLKEFAPASKPDEGAGVVAGDPSILALRVPDPYGGPPWGLRVFASSRGGSCVQVGRVQSGKLGRVVGGADGRERFRQLQTLPGVNSLCGGVERGGFPVLRGLRRLEIHGGTGDPRRCSGGPCPIDQVRVIRFGLLGPQAREARFVDASRMTATQSLTPAQGGAYLFVRKTPAAPFQAADRAQQTLDRRVLRRSRQLRARGVSEAEVMKQLNRMARELFRTRSRPSTQGDDGIDAAFADGSVLRVAGRGRTNEALPGVRRSQGTAPSVRSPLRVTVSGTGAKRQFTLLFRAPVAITRIDRHYTLSASGRDGSRCTLQIAKGGQATTRDIAKGEMVTFRDVRARRNTGTGRRTWCPGVTTLRVGYQTPGSAFAGRLVGSYRFTVKP